MATVMAMKINYDNRPRLPDHLKYTTQPTADEYKRFIENFEENNTGGNGFHECMNFQNLENQPMRIYIPPTCRPSREKENNEFIIFSFTYASDPEKPSRIIGVHAGAHMVCNEDRGIARTSVDYFGEQQPFGTLCYHAEAPSELSTYFYSPIEYDFRAGRHTRAYTVWGNGRRYLNGKGFEHDPSYALNIIGDALEQTRQLSKNPGSTPPFLIQRQIDVLERIRRRYFPDASSGQESVPPPPTGGGFNVAGLPDRKIGEMGERLVYEKERQKMTELELPESLVDWVSQADPHAPYDIKTVRKVGNQTVPLYLEVKSSASSEGVNIFVSQRQIDWMEQHGENALFVLVSFRQDGREPEIQEISLADVRDDYDFTPIKFKLTRNRKPRKP